jgi:TonB family protein
MMIDTALLSGLWQGAFITAIAALITFFVPQRHAATRYAVWFSALLALAILPLASLWHSVPHIVAVPPSVEHTAAVSSQVTAQAASASGNWLVLFWLIGVAFGLARLTASYLRIHRIVRKASPAPELGPDVMTSGNVVIPIAARLFAPVVIIPSALTSMLERSDLDDILRHERAHIARRDVAGNFVQRVIEACLFFNPWVYVIGPQQRRLPIPLLTPSAIGSKRMLVGRIARLLNGKASQLKTNYLVVAANVAALAAFAVLLATTNGLATVSCVFPNGYSDVKPKKPAAPNIPKADYRPNLSANALVTVGADGRAVNAKVVKSSGNAVVDRATVQAAMESTYSPKQRACHAVTGDYLFNVDTGP